MNWTTIANTVASMAPTVGQALAGPAGHLVGQAVSRILGVENTPDAIHEALKTDPAAAVKLAELETQLKQSTLEHDTRRQEIEHGARTDQLKSINTTMQSELSSTDGFKSRWRSAIGWTMALSFGWISVMLGVAIILDPSQLAEVMDGIVMLIVSMGAVLGVNIRQVSVERMASMGQRPHSLMSSILTRPRAG
ncbi:3TM-type holin [Larsenimonas rhizosphaerae]|uniref:3TM-type holin n=1 Tax=Larsenimonas rhizosphaerae TaxID=2944682 RepID=UPI00203458F9|nr:3TM-type holin [Larsenimonas rhizosphaerae]MCM2130314.1 holin family protein [Larsenimonas rhizosphaerae]